MIKRNAHVIDRAGYAPRRVVRRAPRQPFFLLIGRHSARCFDLDKVNLPATDDLQIRDAFAEAGDAVGCAPALRAA